MKVGAARLCFVW